MISDQRIQRNVQPLRCGRKWFDWCWGAGKVDTSAGVSWYLVSNNIYHVCNWKLLQFKFVFNWTCICAWLSWYQYSLNIKCPLINMCPIVTFQICALLDLYSIDGEKVGRLFHALLWSVRHQGITAKPCNHFLSNCKGWQNLAPFRREQKWQWEFSSSAYLQFLRQMRRFCA